VFQKIEHLHFSKSSAPHVMSSAQPFDFNTACEVFAIGATNLDTPQTNDTWIRSYRSLVSAWFIT
jgi:hypothetical protein